MAPLAKSPPGSRLLCGSGLRIGAQGPKRRSRRIGALDGARSRLAPQEPIPAKAPPATLCRTSLPAALVIAECNAAMRAARKP